MSEDEPQDPLTPLAGFAAGLHEIFESWMEAGFTREEAFEILIETIKAFPAPGM